MYASSAVPGSTHNCGANRENIPIKTYENCAVLDELSRLSDNTSVSDHCPTTCDCKCNEHKNSAENCTPTTNTCNCKNNVKKKCKSNLIDSFGIDDAIILLLIILFLTDGNNCNDIMIPVLLGVLLLT